MPLSEAYLQQVEDQLSQHAPALAEAFRESHAALPADLPAEKAELWAQEALNLASHALRSWEALGDYLRVTPTVVTQLNEAGYRQWASAGRELTEAAPAIAAAYYRASPDVVPVLAGVQVGDWAALGQRLYKATWKSISLASEFFDNSPVLLRGLSLNELGRLTHVLEGISDRSADLAAACLDAAPHAVESLDHAEMVAFLEFAASISDSAWPEASLYFQRGPELLRGVEASQRASYLELSTRVARRIGRQSYALFAEGTSALRDVNGDRHRRFIELGEKLVGVSPVAAMSFLKSAPVLADRLRPDELEAWHEAGAEILRGSVEGGEAYFRLESGRAEQMIQTLSARVDLSRVNELLRLYGKALTGANISVQPLSALEGKGIGWVQERGPSTEGTSVYLPEFIEQFDTKPENFAIYKVYATHQTAHIEFGSFVFSFRRAGSVLPRRRQLRERERRAEGLVTKRKWLTDMERFFDLFGERQMASDLFALVEDHRIDRRVHFEYSGIRRASRQVQERELQRRPEVRSLPLRQAFVENLIRASLDGESTMEWPKPLESLLARAILTLRHMQQEQSVVEDAAEATLILYELAEQVPNLPPELLQDLDWETMTEEQLQELEQQAKDGAEEALEDLPQGEEVPYESPEPIEFRGDFKPELVQLLMRMRSQDTDEDTQDLSDLSPEEIKELLEKSVEVDVDMDEFDMSQLAAMIENLEKEAGSPPSDDDIPDDAPTLENPNVPEIPPEVKTYYYDEWDFRATDYKPRWCAVRERYLEQGEEDFYENTLRHHSSLVNETQRQFELLKPETFRKLKKLEDGEDIDLDAAIEFISQKKAGHGDVQKIYWRRNTVERDVAVAFRL
ncbi:MAG TPA: hypothetical protein VG845_12120, partial [Dehalococcoidia bacterium]|nr:hypothetical protein [Dehalococcoidia bacterium]